jgi:Tol biopolymer transport system component
MFGRWTLLATLNTPNNDEQASLSPDELTVYFSRDEGSGNYDLYQATRASKDVPFGNVMPVPGVNTGAQDRYPGVTADGLTIFATSRATSSSQYRVTFATRGSKSGAFGALQPVDIVNGTGNDTDPFISSDGRVMYFASDRGGNYDLYRSEKTGASFSAPVPVMGTNINTVYAEGTPVVSADELTLFFASTRKGTPDIYQATRANRQDPFGEPKAIPELNTATDPDLPSWISADGCEMYFTRFDPANGLQLASSLRGK